VLPTCLGELGKDHKTLGQRRFLTTRIPLIPAWKVQWKPYVLGVEGAVKCSVARAATVTEKLTPPSRDVTL
jgi:hypothetical protein